MTQTAENFEEQVRESFECINSFDYFVRNYCWIEDKNTGSAIPFDLWPAQRDVVPKFLSSYRLIILKARQLGLTWLTASYCLWLAITKPLQLIVVISATEDLAKEFLGRIAFMRARLPGWLHPPVKRETSENLEFSHMDEQGHPVSSVIQSLPTTEKGAQSKTPTVMVIDESALNRYFRSIFASSKPGLDAAKGRLVIISNAIKTAPGWPFTRELYQNSMRGENDFDRIFMDWQARPDRPADFIQRQLREGMHEEDVSQHYPASEDEAISTMLGSYFGKTLARHSGTTQDGVRGYLVKDKAGEIEFREDRKGALEVWRFPYHETDSWDGSWWARRYAGGSDVSEGLGQSYSVAYIMDRHFDELACRLRSNRIDAHTWAEMLHLLAQWYKSAVEFRPDGSLAYDNALLCVERTGAGQTTVKRLKDLGANQYVRQMPGKLKGEWTSEFGWSETEQAKHDLSEDLRRWFRTCRGHVYDAILLDECSTWIQPEGTRRLGPEEGHYGDCVIAAGCTVQADLFLGGSPKRLEPPLTGWRARIFEEEGDRSEWTL